MMVFISWSGERSNQLGEALKEWLPNVLQSVNPYFTPHDLEKGARWSEDISQKLEEAQIGIICLTEENLKSEWILFEAGALSKKLENSYVCPVLFGINNTDVSGPLKQFQSTTFEKKEFLKLIKIINSRLGERKLEGKILDNVFDKWWPDLEENVNKIMKATENNIENKTPIRSDRELLEEVLLLNRVLAKNSKAPRVGLNAKAVTEILEGFINIHNLQESKMGDYQETLNALKLFYPQLLNIAKTYSGRSTEVINMIKEFENLSFKVENPSEFESSDDLPF